VDRRDRRGRTGGGAGDARGGGRENDRREGGAGRVTQGQRLIGHMKRDLIAALDVGKTHSRVSLVELTSGAEVWSERRTNQSVDTPLGRQLDIARIEHWLIDTLRTLPDRTRLDAIVPIAHGAAGVLLDR